MNKKAWKTEAAGVVSIVFATTRARARYCTQQAAQHAGWSHVRWIDIRAVRCAIYDHLPQLLPHHEGWNCLDERYILAELRRAYQPRRRNDR